MITSFIQNNIKIAFLFLLAVVCAFPMFASAQTPVVQLSINGGSDAAITNGQSVTLSWYISGAVSNCSINNGVGAIDTSSLPASGSRVVTPPDNASTNYALTCNGGSSAVVVYVNPVITLTSVQGNTVSLNPLYGQVTPLDIVWTSRYATKCTKVWRETISNPGVQLWTSNSDNPNRLQPNGTVSFTESNAQAAITESAIFYITCENEVTGTIATQSVTVTVSNGAQPPAPTVDIWTWRGTTVAPDPIVGWAYADLGFAATNVTTCSLEAYRSDNSPYAQLPEGFGFWGEEQTADVDEDDFWVRIAETTRFEVTCTQPAYTYGGNNYPATVVSDSVTITVSPPVGDRSTVPPIVLNVEVLDTQPAVVDPLLGYAQVSIHMTVANAEICYYGASSPDPHWGWAQGWWGQNNSGDVDGTIVISIPTTTTLYATCVRDYDLINYATGTPEHTAGSVSTSTIVITVDDTSPAPAVETYVYGHAVWLDAWYIWDNSTADSNFTMNSGATGVALPALRTTNDNVGIPVVTASVTFPFVASDSASDEYDIHVKYCDENDGVNDFTLTTESGYSYSWSSDSRSMHDEWCNTWNTEISKLVGSNVPLSDGELITIQCSNVTTTGAKDEPCVIMGVGFGQGNNSSVVSTVSTSTGFAPASILWMSEYSDDCKDPIADTQSGTPYVYAFNYDTHHYVDTDISTTTTFSVTCYRDTGEETISTVEVIASLGAGPIVATTSVATGDCFDPTIPPSGAIRAANPGERANPSTGFCEPAVDLVAVSPSANPGSAIADNVNGVYDSLDAIILIQNFGEGELPAGSDITYPAVINFDQVYVDEFGVPAQISTPLTPGFNASIGAPTMVGGVPTPPTESPLLTKTFDGVPFGTHELCSRINLDGVVYPEWNIDYSNNTSCTTVTLPVPEPPMSLTVNRSAVRSGQSVTIDWNLNVTYDMSCTVKGPGGVNQTIAAGSPPTNPYVGSVTTTPLTSTSKFVFTCTEPLTNTVFSREYTVDVIPVTEEL